jgi:hypothetical protein
LETPRKTKSKKGRLNENFLNQNGYQEKANFCGLWCLLFGVIYFAVKGVWTHVFVGLILAFLTCGISWLIYPFFAGKIVRKSYLKKGWRQLT